ncbi:MAG: Peptidase superfamily [Candidatus Krumholzibacteriota bacterium]|jgi:hypothetical protein|nr:Peptidase superfamily [Candidatus Krumholzibacteriota bacterium]
MSRGIAFLTLVAAAAFFAGCGGDKKAPESAQTETASGAKPRETDVQYPPANPLYKVQGATLDSLRVKKKRFDITRDEYMEGEGGVLANKYFEIWYPEGGTTVTHAMYVFEELMPARKKLEEYFGQAPADLFVIRNTLEIDVYKRVTGRDWWYYSDIKGDTATFVPVYTLYKRGISPIAVPHEYYQWAVRKFTRHGAPRWLEEGIASRLSGEGPLLLDQLNEFGEENLSMSPERIDEVLQGEEDRRDTRIAYYHSYRMVERIAEKYGEDKLKSAVTLIGLGKTVDEAFTEAFGTGETAVVKDALDYTVVLPKKKRP